MSSGCEIPSAGSGAAFRAPIADSVVVPSTGTAAHGAATRASFRFASARGDLMAQAERDDRTSESDDCRSIADGHRCEVGAEGHDGLHGADFGDSDGFITWTDASEDGCEECGARPLDPHNETCHRAAMSTDGEGTNDGR